jgi:hypothetical protein
MVKEPTAAPKAPASEVVVQPTMVTLLRDLLRNRTRGIEILVVAAVILVFATAAMTIFSLSFGKHANATESQRQITLTLKATPLETRFSIDDGPLQDNPFVGRYGFDEHDHVVRAIAPGYPPKEETVKFNGDQSIRFTLSNKK